MPRSAVRVFLRNRPVGGASDAFRVQADHKTVLAMMHKSDKGLVNNQQDSMTFKFDSILQDASQEEVFNAAALDVVESVVEGVNGTIFAYGQTGSGKTFTISGENSSYVQRGIIPRTAHHIFREIDMRVDREVTVRCSFLEIYNEELYDLFTDSPGSPAPLAVVEENGVTKIRGLTKRVVASEEEALAMFFSGEAARSTARHTLNDQSSRSHCIFTLYLETRQGGDADERVIQSKINLVDLAGSERTKKTDVSGQTLIEASYINKSLTFLEQAVNAITKKTPGHIPYRNSQLTCVLKDAIGGNCKTSMIACVWPESAHAEETVSTLRFASRVKLLTTNPVVNEKDDPALLARRYLRQLTELKQELAMRDAFAGRGRVDYDISEMTRMQIGENVQRFLDSEDTADDVDMLEIVGVKHVKETFKAFKYKYLQLKATLGEGGSVAVGDKRLETAGTDSGALGGDVAAEGGEALVGDAEGGAGMSVGGEAPASARPTEAEEAAARGEAAAAPAPVLENEQSRMSSLLGGAAAGGGMMGSGTDRRDAYEVYKKSEGSALAESLRLSIASAREAKKSAADLGRELNALKIKIDTLSNSVGKIEEGTRMEADRLEAHKQLKAAKAEYRSSFDTFKLAKTSSMAADETVQQARTALVDAFEAWYTALLDKAAKEEDAAEEFERVMAERVMSSDPESAAFHAARREAGRFAKAAPASAFAGRKSGGIQARKTEQKTRAFFGLE